MHQQLPEAKTQLFLHIPLASPKSDQVGGCSMVRFEAYQPCKSSLGPISRPVEFHHSFNHLKCGIPVPPGDICAGLGVHREAPVARQHHSIISVVSHDPGIDWSSSRQCFFAIPHIFFSEEQHTPTYESFMISVGVPFMTPTPLDLAYHLH